MPATKKQIWAQDRNFMLMRLYGMLSTTRGSVIFKYLDRETVNRLQENIEEAISEMEEQNTYEKWHIKRQRR